MGTNRRVITRDEYEKQWALPVYLFVTSDEKTYMEIGERYLIAVESDGKKHYTHEAICLGCGIVKDLDETPDEVLAFAAQTVSRSEMIETFKKHAGEEASQMRICMMLRTDKAENFVKNGVVGHKSIKDEVSDPDIDYVTDADKTDAVAKREIEDQ